MKAAYGFSTSATAGAWKTIALVDAYNDPTAANDLSEVSTKFGLPTCTAAYGCFKNVNQTGRTNYPGNNAGWALEISPDIEWAHAIAPGARILLVEASNASFNNLLAAEDYASEHANYVSNSWDGGGGCSSFETAVSAQSGYSGYTQVACAGKRATPDVSLDAAPNSGAAVYERTKYNGESGWWQVGGTSLSTPIVAGRSADAGVVTNAAYIYGNHITFRDINSGNNGAPCLTGFDLCSGLGSWTGATP